MEEDSTKWVEKDLLELISGKIEEHSALDYKRSDALNLEIESKNIDLSKDVSAFANSEGGAIIYGIPEKDHIPQPIDGGLDPIIITKERVEQTIQSRIHRIVSGLHINPVRLEKSASGRVAYVITIPQTDTAHQADDKRYYMRFNFESVAMDDYEVRDVINRSKHPIIIPSIKTSSINSNAIEHVYGLEIILENQGLMSAHNIKFEFDFPARLITETAPIFTRSATQILKKRPSYESSYFSFSRYGTPLFPTENLPLPALKAPALKFKITEELYAFCIRFTPSLAWRLYADDAMPREDEISLSALHIF